MKSMHLVYIAGPYTADTSFQVEKNITAAKLTAMEVCALGMNAYPVTPHLNTPHFEGLRDGNFFVEGTKKLMLRCDAVLIVLGADISISSGTKGEIEAAKEAGIPIFWNLLDLRRWLAKQEREQKSTSPIQKLKNYVKSIKNQE